MIRKLVENDYDEISKLVDQVHEIHLKARPDIYNDVSPLPYTFFIKVLDSNYNFVYEEDGKILGLVMGEVQDSSNIPLIKKRRALFINDIVVDKEARGRGIGTKLYNQVKDIALSSGLDAVELNVWAFNEDAIAFYTKLGLKYKNIRMEDTF